MKTFNPFVRKSIYDRLLLLNSQWVYSVRKNGIADCDKLILPRREIHFSEELEKFSSMRLSEDQYELLGGVNFEMSLKKMFLGEEYGVEQEIRRFREEGFDTVPDLLLMIAIEETYHVRYLQMLFEACNAAKSIKVENRFIKLFTKLIFYFPHTLRYALILCGEVVGAAFFSVIREHVSNVMDSGSEKDQIHQLISEILNDEISHVAYCRSMLGPIGILLSRLLYPLVWLVIATSISEIRLLGNCFESLKTYRRPSKIFFDAPSWMAIVLEEDEHQSMVVEEAI